MIPRFTGHAEEFYEDRGARTSNLAGGNLRETGYVQTGERRTARDLTAPAMAIGSNPLSSTR